MSHAEFQDLLTLIRSWHPRAAQDLLARLKAGGDRRYARG
jgi:hypothetical protein